MGPILSTPVATAPTSGPKAALQSLAAGSRSTSVANVSGALRPQLSSLCCEAASARRSKAGPASGPKLARRFERAPAHCASTGGGCASIRTPRAIRPSRACSEKRARKRHLSSLETRSGSMSPHSSANRSATSRQALFPSSPPVGTGASSTGSRAEVPPSGSSPSAPSVSALPAAANSASAALGRRHLRLRRSRPSACLTRERLSMAAGAPRTAGEAWRSTRGQSCRRFMVIGTGGGRRSS
mmetsp:Transcript_10763/g.32378  ORF Transcript_10763/g.32378 Transcript_10763/m.32378 type:complete len:241 (+) Transcript_10763:563-1285(+)